MPAIEALAKSDRLLVVLILLRQRPEGVRTVEISELLGVSQRTARRYLSELSEKGRLRVVPTGRVWILVGTARFDLLPVRLDLDVALALYLSARLLSYHSDRHNSHVTSALHKLATNMPLAVGRHMLRTADSVVRRRAYPGFIENLETLTRAWAGQRQVRLRYRDPRTTEVTERVFDIYFIDPPIVGTSWCVIGYDHLRNEIRVFKIERIDHVELLDTLFEVRCEFDPFAFLAQAWGMVGGAEGTGVKLRFAAAVSNRIRKYRWPGVVQVEDEGKRGCVMTLKVSHVLEMIPWIRGWGADCEALEPDSLRAELANEMGKAADVHGT